MGKLNRTDNQGARKVDNTIINTENTRKHGQYLLEQMKGVYGQNKRKNHTGKLLEDQ